jgi:hypothetical protein
MAAARAVRAQNDAQNWDDFWGEVNAARTTEVIRGVTVPVPTDLPLIFKQRMTELQDSDRDEDVRELVALVFGEGVLDQWRDAGMGAQELKVLLAWGFANGSGKPTSFREAFEIVTEAEAQGKAPGAPNRAARRAATNARSSASGAASKPTSRASTASARKASRT